jgi:hypothetical protein
MHFGPISTDLEPFIDRVPEKAKHTNIIINHERKNLNIDKPPEFLIC